MYTHASVYVVFHALSCSGRDLFEINHTWSLWPKPSAAQDNRAVLSKSCGSMLADTNPDNVAGASVIAKIMVPYS